MRVFVAGRLGGLGRRMVRTLARAGHAVLVTADGDDGSWVRRAGATQVEVDLYDPGGLSDVLAGCSAAICLTSTSPPLGRLRLSSEWEETTWRQTEDARRIAEACITEGVGCYVHQSVAAVYRDGGERWLDEDSPVDSAGWPPLSSALAGEAHAHNVTQSGGRGVVLRFAALYSSDEPQAVELAARMRHRKVVLVGRGRNYLSTVHVDDAAAALVAALDAPAGIYNVGDDEPLALRDNLAALAVAIDAPPLRRLPGFFGPAVLGGAWQWLRRSVRIDSRRLREATGWSPSVSDVRLGWARTAAEWAADIHRG